jgi:hypothetical protein
LNPATKVTALQLIPGVDEAVSVLISVHNTGIVTQQLPKARLGIPFRKSGVASLNEILVLESPKGLKTFQFSLRILRNLEHKNRRQGILTAQIEIAFYLGPAFRGVIQAVGVTQKQSAIVRSGLLESTQPAYKQRIGCRLPVKALGKERNIAGKAIQAFLRKLNGLTGSPEVGKRPTAQSVEPWLIVGSFAQPELKHVEGIRRPAAAKSDLRVVRGYGVGTKIFEGVRFEGLQHEREGLPSPKLRSPDDPTLQRQEVR